jgi:hypothetical protein
MRLDAIRKSSDLTIPGRPEPGPQLGEGDIAPDLGVQVEHHAAILQQFPAPQDDVLFQLEAGDTVDQQPAGPVVALIDMHLVAAAAQLLRRGQAARSGAHDAD